MKPKWKRTLSVLFLASVALLTLFTAVREVYAWALYVDPSSRNVFAGETRVFNVIVDGFISGNPNVHLYVGVHIGLTISFSVNDRPAPFTSAMTVAVSAALEVFGYRNIAVYADPAGAEPPLVKQVTLNILGPPPSTTTYLYVVWVRPTSKSVQQGASTTYMVVVDGMIPGNPIMHLMVGGPSIVGMTFSFSTNDRPAPFTSTMTVNVASTVGPSDYSRTVIAHPSSGATDMYVTFHVVVQAASVYTVYPGWDLTVTPASANVAPGASSTFTVHVGGDSGGTSIRITYSPPVTGISAAFSINNRPAPFDSVMTVSVDSSKPLGSYVVQVWAYPAGSVFPGPDSKQRSVTVIVTTSGPSLTTTSTPTSVPSTDWAVLSVGWTPTAPHAGDSVIFNATLSLLSTTGTLPQTVNIQCTFNGNPCGTKTISHSGPVGATLSVQAETPWIAVAGTHKLVWSISRTNDPDPDNNAMVGTITILAESTTLATTSTSFSQTGTAVQQVTSVLETGVQTETPTKILGGEILGTIQQNSPLIIGILAALIVLLAALAFRRRKKEPGQQTHSDHANGR
jgi:LPXTG-motif cell wall-anchored protein